MIRILLLSLFAAAPAAADMLVAAHTIRAKTVLGPEDLAMTHGNVPGTLDEIDAVIGQEARVTLYAGRPIRAGDIGPPAIVERNQVVTMNFAHSGISISTEARVLDRAGVGDRVRAMNLNSRNTVFGIVQQDGSIYVDGGPK